MAVDEHRAPRTTESDDARRLVKARRPGFGIGLLKGMAVTLKHLFKHNTVIQYPDEKQDLSSRTRGVIALKEENCTVCMLCARECPDWCIYIDSHKETLAPKREGGRPRKRNILDRFAIDYALCMYCGICVEVCPYDALFWSREFEYAEYDIRELTHEKEKLSDWMASVLPPPALEEGAEYPGSPTRAPEVADGAAAPVKPVQAEASDAAAGTPERRGAQAAPLGTGGRPADAGAPKEAKPDVGPVPGRQAEAAPAPEGAEPAAAEAPPVQEEEQQAAPSQEQAPGPEPTAEDHAGPGGRTETASPEVLGIQMGAEPASPSPRESTETPSPEVLGIQMGGGPAPSPGAGEDAVGAPEEAETRTPQEGPDPEEVARLQETPGPNVEVPNEEPKPTALDPTEDPKEVYEAVLSDQLAKGSSPEVAEARAKVARVKAERGIARNPGVATKEDS